MEDDTSWRKNLEPREPDKSLHEMVAGFLGTEVSEPHQTLLRRSHQETAKTAYLDNSMQKIKSLITDRIAWFKEIVTNEHPHRRDIIDELDTLRQDIAGQSRKHYFPQDFRLQPPKGKETYEDIFRLDAFLHTEGSYIIQQRIDASEQIREIVKDLYPVQINQPEEAAEHAIIGKNLRILHQALENLAKPPDQINHKTFIAAVNTVTHHANAILQRALASNQNSYRDNSVHWMKVIIDGLEDVPYPQREPLLSQLQEKLGVKKIYEKKDATHIAFFVKITPDTLKVFKDAGLLSETQHEEASQEITGITAIIATLKDMQTALAPVIKKAQGEGRGIDKDPRDS